MELREEDTMTTPTIAEVSRGSKEPTVVEISGFRGRLISADHADTTSRGQSGTVPLTGGRA